MFHPLDLPEEQRVKMSLYIEVRDTYYHLYNVEADTLAPHPALRVMLNSLYDNFVERFGRLNEPQNIDRIRMDPGADEILAGTLHRRYREQGRHLRPSRRLQSGGDRKDGRRAYGTGGQHEPLCGH